MKPVKERKPDVSAKKLKAAGYAYKLKELTKEEKLIQKHGIKETDPKTGKVKTYDPPDLNYYYKVIGDVTVKLFKVGDRFYYKNTWFRYMAKLPALEALAKEEKKYDDLQALVVDTEPLADTNPIDIKLKPGQVIIALSGGPLDGSEHVWSEGYPMFMRQFKDTEGVVKSARYRRDIDFKTIYHFVDIIG